MLIIIAMDKLTAAQQQLTRWLHSYEDEFFPLLYYDVAGFAEKTAPGVFHHGRSISLYGVRGIGKTTLAQGILASGLRSSADDNGKFLPVVVSVKGSRSVDTLRELEDRFYQSVLQSLLGAAGLRDRFERAKRMARSYAPWVAAKAVEAAGLVFPPAFLASDVVKREVGKLLDRTGLKQPERLVLTIDVGRWSSVDLLLEKLAVGEMAPVCSKVGLD